MAENQNEFWTELCDKAEHVFNEIIIWMVFHPLSSVALIFVLVFIVPKIPDWCFYWEIMAFYPARFDFSSICIGGGCPSL